MTRDCSLNSPENTSSQHVVYKYCSGCQNKKQFLYTKCCELVFFREFNERSLVLCGLTNVRMRASEKDLPVNWTLGSPSNPAKS